MTGVLLCGLRLRDPAATYPVMCGRPLDAEGNCPEHGWPLIAVESGEQRPAVAERITTTEPDVTRPLTVQQLQQLAERIADADRSYRQALSEMGAHGAPAAEVVAFAVERHVKRGTVPPDPVTGRVGMGVTFPEIAAAVVHALRETGHLR